MEITHADGNDFVVEAGAQEGHGGSDLAGMAAAAGGDRGVRRTRAPPLAPKEAAPANPVSVLDREVIRELVREIGEQAASEVHAVFTAETEARLKLLRGLGMSSERTRNRTGGAFAQEQRRNVRLSRTRRARAAARARSGTARRGRVSRAAGSMDAAYSSAAALELQG